MAELEAEQQAKQQARQQQQENAMQQQGGSGGEKPSEDDQQGESQEDGEPSPGEGEARQPEVLPRAALPGLHGYRAQLLLFAS